MALEPEVLAAELETRQTEQNVRLQQQVRDLELELAQTKLRLVQSECHIQVSRKLVTRSREVYSYQVYLHTFISSVLYTRLSEKLCRLIMEEIQQFTLAGFLAV